MVWIFLNKQKAIPYKDADRNLLRADLQLWQSIKCSHPYSHVQLTNTVCACQVIQFNRVITANLLATKRIHQQINIRKGSCQSKKGYYFLSFEIRVTFIHEFFKLWTLIRVIKVSSLCLSICLCLYLFMSVSVFSLFLFFPLSSSI